MKTMARETWTDERLDDLKDGMHREFDQVHGELQGINCRLDSMQLTLIAGALAIVAAIIAAGIF
jgi:hypothetical protein